MRAHPQRGIRGSIPPPAHTGSSRAVGAEPCPPVPATRSARQLALRASDGRRSGAAAGISGVGRARRCLRHRSSPGRSDVAPRRPDRADQRASAPSDRERTRAISKNGSPVLDLEPGDRHRRAARPERATRRHQRPSGVDVPADPACPVRPGRGEWSAKVGIAPIRDAFSELPGYALVLLAMSPNDTAERFLARDAFWTAVMKRT